MKCEECDCEMVENYDSSIKMWEWICHKCKKKVVSGFGR